MYISNSVTKNVFYEYGSLHVHFMLHLFLRLTNVCDELALWLYLACFPSASMWLVDFPSLDTNDIMLY